MKKSIESRLRTSLLARRVAERLRQCGDVIVGWVRSVARPERLCVHLGIDGLAVCRVAGRFKPIVQDQTFLSADSDSHDLTTRLAKLHTWMNAHPGRGSIDWIVGMDYARYLLLPWNSRLSSGDFCRSVAAALYARQFSENATRFSDHRLRFAPLSFARPRLAALISNDVIHELTAFSMQRQYRVRRITPSLSVVWNHLYKHARASKGVLAMIEGARLLQITSDRGHIVSLSIRPFAGDQCTAALTDVTWTFPPHLTAARPDHTVFADKRVLVSDARMAYALCGAV